MATYNSIIERSVLGGALIPEPVATEVIAEAPKGSVVLDNARRVAMSSKTLKQPVLASLPAAVLLIVAQRYISAGALGGAVK